MPSRSLGVLSIAAERCNRSGAVPHNHLQLEAPMIHIMELADGWWLMEWPLEQGCSMMPSLEAALERADGATCHVEPLYVAGDEELSRLCS